MIFTLSSLKETSKRRLSGYLEDALSIGKKIGNDKYEFTSEQINYLSKYKKPIKLGDAVASIATPIARAMNLPCIDPNTKELRPESGCAKRKEFLNSLLTITPNQSNKSDLPEQPSL